jgi:HlyD family secretion protein
MRIRWGRILWIVAALTAAAGVAWSFLPQPIPVETAQVTTGHFVATVDESGKTRIRERYVVTAPLAGRLTRIDLRAGDSLGHHERITTIFPAPAPLLDPRSRREAEERLGAAEASHERAKAMIERARAEAEQSRAELERMRKLAERGIAAAQALERAELAARLFDRALTAAELQEHATGHELEQARAVLARYDQGAKPGEPWEVTAPVAGVVLKVLQESETVTTPGQALVDIGDPQDLEVVVDVLSTDAVEVRAGAEVSIERWGGPGNLIGRVRRVEPAAFTKISTLGVEEQRVNVIIDLLSPPTSRATLGDGFRVEVRITVFSLDDALIAPAGALFRVGDVWNVYTVNGGRAELRAVEITRRAGRLAAVKSGLQAGDVVIVYPSDRVTAGAKVEPR